MHHPFPRSQPWNIIHNFILIVTLIASTFNNTVLSILSVLSISYLCTQLPLSSLSQASSGVHQKAKSRLLIKSAPQAKLENQTKIREVRIQYEQFYENIHSLLYFIRCSRSNIWTAASLVARIGWMRLLSQPFIVWRVGRVGADMSQNVSLSGYLEPALEGGRQNSPVSSWAP